MELKKYQDNALKFELHSKGDISIHVWDDDDTSADSLGFVKLSLEKLLSSRNKKKCNLRGPVAEPKDTEESAALADAHQQWFERPREVRVFEGDKTELTGCTLQNANTALIYYEAYFFPDWDEELILEQDQTGKRSTATWSKKEEEFNKNGEDFAKRYREPFQDSIGARPAHSELFRKETNLRRFICVAKHPQTSDMLPMMAFLCAIITPEEYTRPAELLHWVNCITFSNSSRQKRHGEIPQDAWNDPQTFLFTRKGPVQGQGRR